MINKLLNNIYVGGFISYFISLVVYSQISLAKTLSLKADYDFNTIDLFEIITTIIIAVLVINYGINKRKTPAELISSIIVACILFTLCVILLYYYTDILNIHQHHVIIIKRAIYCIFNSMELVFKTITWGMINNICNKEKYKMTYLFMSLGFLIILNFVGVIYAIFSQFFVPETIRSLLFAAIGMILLFFFVKQWSSATKHHLTAGKQDIQLKPFPWIKASLILLTSGSVYSLFNYFLLKNKPMSSPFLDLPPDVFFSGTNIYIVRLLIFLFVLGLAFYILRKKTWGVLAIVGISLLLTMSLMAMLLMEFTSLLFWDIDTVLRVIYTLIYPLILFPFVQFLYLFLPRMDRYLLKIKTEMIGLPILVFAASYIIPSITKIFTNEAVGMYVSGILGVLLLSSILYVTLQLCKQIKLNHTT